MIRKQSTKMPLTIIYKGILTPKKANVKLDTAKRIKPNIDKTLILMFPRRLGQRIPKAGTKEKPNDKKEPIPQTTAL